MDVQESVLKGAAFMAGVGAEFFGATETVIGGGHYVADGLRKAADCVDWVTDQGQEFCRNRKESCENRQKELMGKLEAMSKAQFTKEELKDMEKMAEQMMADMKEAVKEAKMDIEDAEFTDVKTEEEKTEAPKVLKDDPILV